MPFHKQQIYELGLSFDGQHHEAQLVALRPSFLVKDLSAPRRYVGVRSLVQFLTRIQSVQRHMLRGKHDRDVGWLLRIVV
jgi:hypothetical protein